MSGEISSFQQLFKVVWESYRIELDDATTELLDAAWMHVTVDVAIAVEKIKAEDY